jgi:hypothetical protein
MPKLLDQVRLTLRARHYSIRTERSYVSWIRDFILFHEKRHPKELDARHISSWLSHLATDRQVAASTQNQALSNTGVLEIQGEHQHTTRFRTRSYSLLSLFHFPI